MTENEAISVLKMIEAHGSLSSKAKEMAIKSLSEIQQYRAIGTVEELQALKEKSEPKKAKYDNEDGWETYICPSCGKAVGEHQKYCWNCGQAFET